MESETNVLELLFKLASLGVAGISVVAVFYCAIIIKNLPDNIPPARENLTRKFINLCWVAIIVCGISGCFNVYLNSKKIQKAKDETAYVKNLYRIQLNELTSAKASIIKDLNSLQNKISHQNYNADISQTMSTLNRNIVALDLKPDNALIIK
ncbi:MAG TPA: hypothetical protein VMT63_11190 [Bacteroidales bacterium]|nr:hypothetical protein [Bacteroidales bacterium]